MSLAVPQVFISSTSEFAAERELLKQQIDSLPDFRFHAYTYETDAAGAKPPEVRLRGILESSEIFVLILGDTFGSEYPGSTQSIVEWEYEYAKARNKELKGYVKHPAGPHLDPRQAAFVARATAFRNGSWIRRFAAAPQLVAGVVTDLKNWIIAAGTSWVVGQPERNRWKERVVLSVAAAVSLLTLGSIIAGVFLDVSLERLALVFACEVTTFAGLFVLLKSKIF